MLILAFLLSFLAVVGKWTRGIAERKLRLSEQDELQGRVAQLTGMMAWRIAVTFLAGSVAIGWIASLDEFAPREQAFAMAAVCLGMSFLMSPLFLLQAWWVARGLVRSRHRELRAREGDAKDQRIRELSAELERQERQTFGPRA